MAGEKSKEHVNSSGVILLQWLTYLFWGWTVIAMSILTAFVLDYFIKNTGIQSMDSAYGVAATLVLLPAAIVCDYFYSKKEPVEKSGAATVAMVICSIIFALISIGFLIAAIFSLIQLFVEGFDSKDMLVTLLSSLIVSVLSVAVFLRVIRPKRLLRVIFMAFMSFVSVVVVIFSFVGPLASAVNTRTDRLIMSSLNEIVVSIENYAGANDKLPNSLSDLSLYGDEKRLVTENLVVYKSVGQTTEEYDGELRDVYRYQLCVNYIKPANDALTGTEPYKYDVDSDGYSVTAATYPHPAGEVCYKLKSIEYK